MSFHLIRRGEPERATISATKIGTELYEYLMLCKAGKSDDSVPIQDRQMHDIQQGYSV